MCWQPDFRITVTICHVVVLGSCSASSTSSTGGASSSCSCAIPQRSAAVSRREQPTEQISYMQTQSSGIISGGIDSLNKMVLIPGEERGRPGETSSILRVLILLWSCIPGGEFYMGTDRPGVPGVGIHSSHKLGIRSLVLVVITL